MCRTSPYTDARGRTVTGLKSFVNRPSAACALTAQRPGWALACRWCHLSDCSSDLGMWLFVVAYVLQVSKSHISMRSSDNSRFVWTRLQCALYDNNEADCTVITGIGMESSLFILVTILNHTDLDLWHDGQKFFLAWESRVANLKVLQLSVSEKAHTGQTDRETDAVQYLMRSPCGRAS